MKVMIEIPQEFEEHFERDRFEDSLQRLIVDSHCAAGRYERELCGMLIEALKMSRHIIGAIIILYY